jgi:hypothetical protein
MAKAVTEKFEEMVLEVETAPDTWARICGLKDITVSRSLELDTDEVPDCDDESKPFDKVSEARSITVAAQGSGVWAQQSHKMLMDWFYSGTTKKVRLGNLNAAVGATEYEEGPAFLKSLNNSRSKGKKVTAEIDLEFDGTPTSIAKA